MIIKTYTELRQLHTFEERFNYLKLGGVVGEQTFGWDRYFNQKFYRSKEWKDIRNQVIVRDGACDLGIEGHEIGKNVIVHHMNPFLLKDLLGEHAEDLLNPEYLICVTHETHNAIHYGDESLLLSNCIAERRPNDTCPWKK